MKLFSRILNLKKLKFLKYSTVRTKHKKAKKAIVSNVTNEPCSILPSKYLSQYFNKSLLSRLVKDGYFYIVDTKEAENIASHLTNNWTGDCIFEANPGPGVLTKAVLNNGVNRLLVFEKNKEFLPSLQALSTDHPNLDVVEDDILVLSSLDSKRDPLTFDCFFREIPVRNWEDSVSCRIFSIVFWEKSVKFLRYLLVALVERKSFFSLGRCELFLLLREREYLFMIAEPKMNLFYYRWCTVLYNLFFEMKCLKKYSSEIFYPSPFDPESKALKEEHFYFMKLTPKPNLFSSVVNENKLLEFYFFVRRHLHKRKCFVIPTLEAWIPSCGPRLIKRGINVFTKFGDLSPKQILMLFNEFSSWPEYEDSTFCARPVKHKYK